MNVRKITGAVLVVGLAGGLHWGFRGLAAGLPQLFPRLALEKRVAMLPPVTADDEWPTALPAAEDDPPPPEGAIPLKKAGEDLLASIEDSASTPGKKGDGAGRIGRHLIMATPIPEISGPPRQISESFEISTELAPIVNFWKKVYGVYDSDHVVLHDMENLDIEYGVLDFSDLGSRGLADSEKGDLSRDRPDQGDLDRVG